MKTQSVVLGSGGLDFTIKLIKCAALRPREFVPLQLFDIHTQGSRSESERHDQADCILGTLRERLPGIAVNVRLFLWPTLLERVLLTGDVVEGTAPRIRWGFSFAHVVRPAIDGPDADPTTWTVLPPNHTTRWRKPAAIFVALRGLDTHR